MVDEVGDVHDGVCGLYVYVYVLLLMSVVHVVCLGVCSCDACLVAPRMCDCVGGW